VIAAFRMYEAGPRATAAWRALFERVFADAGVDVTIVEHRFPQPIEALWAEPDLGCAFMCGWPFARSTLGQQPIAAPVPSPPRYAHLPRYFSDYLARAASGWKTLEQSFGHRFGWMAEGSHSGFNAPRAHLATFATAQRPRLFSESIGPLGNPARAIEALGEGRVDVIAIDGYYVDLVRFHDPLRMEGLVTIGSTPWAPIPLLVAAPGIAHATVKKLRDVLVGLHELPTYRPLMDAVLLERFVIPDAAAYAETESMRERAEAAGYGAIV
jgi:ABC-type phosphate/phosphonate transport system substrate-binding protein